MKGRVRLPEAHLLVCVLLMGYGFGLLGVFAAPAFFGVVHYLYVSERPSASLTADKRGKVTS